jgi:hypothetical protein
LIFFWWLFVVAPRRRAESRSREESGEQRAERGEQRAESREQRAESRAERRIERRADLGTYELLYAVCRARVFTHGRRLEP